MNITTIALDQLIESKASNNPMEADNNANDSRQGSRNNGTDKSTDRNHHWSQISPALYATPEPTPLPDSPSSFAPSPYIVDHKRRGPRLFNALSEDVIAIHRAVADEKDTEIVNSLEADIVESSSVVNDTVADIVLDPMLNRTDDASAEPDNFESVELEKDSEMDDFFDPQDSMSFRSSIDGESSSGLERSVNLNASSSEFYDAWEELSSVSGSQPSSHDVETELREMRLSLLVEIEKQKRAEEYINDMRTQWRRIREQLYFVGLNLPEDPTVSQDHSGDDLVEELSRQVHVIRFVSNSIATGVAKAELEPNMEAQIESKNFEIARLVDRLRYYEAVNYEMSQRNQETIESMRRSRQRRKRKQRWIWGLIVAAVTVGSGALVWSYGKGSSLQDAPTSHTSEGSRSAQ
ncbi:uncharacterized protein [Rutidosis leptorrhynchoides]|uniref:uncharacterized protein n=1 Tax=Rutidosis leptorrhynchoides TaxID=125765 RepID=UPI003A9A2AD6